MADSSAASSPRPGCWALAPKSIRRNRKKNLNQIFKSLTTERLSRKNNHDPKEFALGLGNHRATHTTGAVRKGTSEWCPAAGKGTTLPGGSRSEKHAYCAFASPSHMRGGGMSRLEPVLETGKLEVSVQDTLRQQAPPAISTIPSPQSPEPAGASSMEELESEIDLLHSLIRSPTSVKPTIAARAVQESWAVLRSRVSLEAAGVLFSQTLFKATAQTLPVHDDKSLCKSVEIKACAKRFMSRIDEAVGRLDGIHNLAPILCELEGMLSALDAFPVDRDVIGGALINTLALALRGQFRPELRLAWRDVLCADAAFAQTVTRGGQHSYLLSQPSGHDANGIASLHGRPSPIHQSPRSALVARKLHGLRSSGLASSSSQRSSSSATSSSHGPLSSSSAASTTSSSPLTSPD